ncbi:hypothetical protein ROJ8625_02319 [Roseivivax jejudonensis]|uniref:Aspartate carbamoyltransferase catalytic subunit n=1 Tax=Roseivivax jejudonensis TaxID=1529041 RepID=A0A1X6ZCA5_9RHOB|nr:hypothetical protein [Roseivivax jejudonensis]SLN47524.1 hypothetical protein ROJ8625_02319 [Roseivivax jejudonensis]
MSTEIEIRAGETGITRVFHLDLPAEAIARFTDQAGTGEWPVKYALGADALRADFVELVSIRDLGPMPLSAYLAEAHDLSAPERDRAARELDGLRGHVLILPSQAFDRTAQTLRVGSPLRFVGAFGEHDRSPAAAPLRSAAAEGSAAAETGAAQPDQRSPLLRALAIVVLALLLGVVAVLLVPA